MSITSTSTWAKTHRIRENQFEIDQDDPRGMQAIADANKAVRQGDDDKAISILSLNASVKVIDTTPAEPLVEQTFDMKKGVAGSTKKVPKSMVKAYQKDGWKFV